MKQIKIFLIVFLPLLFIFTGCKLEEPDVVQTQTDLKGKTVAQYVALGNSLTAGVQSGSLVEDHQVFSYPNLIAGKLGITSFEQPTVSFPGIDPILQLNPMTESVDPYPGGPGVPTNISAAAYQNLGIPTATTWDVLHATNSTDNYRFFLFGEGNAAVDLVLRGQGSSMFAQAAAQNPDLVTLWIGNNDALGFATSGGLKPLTPFDVGGIIPSPVVPGELIGDFKAAYTELIDTLATLDAMVAVANVPDVTSIPFFRTVGPMMAASGLPALVYQTAADDMVADSANGIAMANDLLSGTVLVTLLGSGYTDEIGKPSGLWLRDLAAMQGYTVEQLLAGMPMVDTLKAFGVSKQNPWPSFLILDADEIAAVQAATAAYNQLIAAKAAEKGFALFDVNEFLNSIKGTLTAPGSYTEQGYTFTPTFVSGGMFSLDGVHVTNAGNAVLANKFIEVINAKYNVAIAPVLIREVLGFSPVKKMSAADMKYDLHSLKGLLEMTGGNIW